MKVTLGRGVSFYLLHDRGHDSGWVFEIQGSVFERSDQPSGDLQAQLGLISLPLFF